MPERLSRHGSLIRRRRRAHGLSQDDLARRLKTTRQIVSSWEKHGAQPTEKHRRRLVRELGGTESDYLKQPGALVAPGRRIGRVEVRLAALEEVVAEIRQRLSDAGQLPG